MNSGSPPKNSDKKQEMKIKVGRERKVSLYWPVGKLLLGFYKVYSPSGDSREQWAATEFYFFLPILS